ncbi:hypothetical protein DTO013E5_7879 [Penicillium roqueforti]|nr:hypothetical protein DTO012A1_4026 [Penicillium roqueforti]KAI2742380.1 hypothetical protein DTO013F2_8541 [Penicillium roqueforti]KAI2774034.1 hypothetical protein DTO012A8_1343 [Penicillium roqueforti]KAI3074533.1 hypothetical protein CBS147339_5910 [Penicillium roqueforti]KAI3106786.1 hypothetical protein CBS147338_787 [Penicillium roqueforti]
MNPDSNEHGYLPARPLPSYYTPSPQNMPQPQMPPTGSSAPNLTPEPYNHSESQRSSPNMHTGHIDNAVSSAFQSSGSTGYLSPEIISQITATVIQQLKTNGLDKLQGSGAPPPGSQSRQPPWQTDGSLQPHKETPSAIPPQRSSSIPPPTSASEKFHTGNSEPYVPSGYASDSHPSPKPAPDPHPYVPSGYASDSHLSPKPTPDPQPSVSSGYSSDSRLSRNSTLDHLSDRRASVSSQTSDRSHPSYYKAERPRPPDRDATVMEMTTLERIWGKLFDDGKATKRLGQFLRGIAVHMIEDYPPGNTLVIPPYKLQKFYRDTHDSNDPYPWQDIFDDRTSSISRLFRDIRVEHHLIQDDLAKRPDIPGLTPKGFETWETLMILANPEREYERLQKAVRNMPINNPEDQKERFPKEIPRRLFPEIADIEIREDVEDRIMVHCGVDLPYITPEERNQTSGRSARSSTTTGSPGERTRSYERGRPPTASAPRPAVVPRPASAVTDDEDEEDEEEDDEVDEGDETITSVPIERERNPYSNSPSIGKVYDEPSPSHDHNHSHSHSHSHIGSTPGQAPAYRMPESYDRESQYARSGSGHSSEKRFSHDPRSSSHHRGGSGTYRHSDTELHGRDHSARHSGLSAHDLSYNEPAANLTEDEARRYRPSRGGDEEYYRGSGQGGAVPRYDQKYEKYYG